MIHLLKILYWDLCSRMGRFQYLNAFLKNIPGSFGIELRGKVIRRYFKSCGKNLKVAPNIKFRNIQCMSVGDNAALGEDSFFQASGGIVLGDNVMIGNSVKIWSTNHRYADSSRPMREQGYDEKEVIIGNNVWIAADVFIHPGAVIGDWCVISAGAVVGAKTIPPYTIMAGNPARKIGEIQNHSQPLPESFGDKP